jgi:hypothetical protein
MWITLERLAIVLAILGGTAEVLNYVEQSATPSWVASMLSPIISPALLNLIVNLSIIFVLIICLWRQNILKKQIEEHINKETIKDLKQKPTQTIVRKERATPTLGAQQLLINILASYGGDPANVSINIAATIHQPLGETLASAFKLANWETTFNNIPLEPQSHTYISGIEIIGFNKHLVEVVTDALKNAGLPEAKATVGETKFKRENPKWDYVQHSIGIIIGHYE